MIIFHYLASISTISHGSTHFLSPHIGGRDCPGECSPIVEKKTKKLHHENSNIHFGKISSVHILCYSLQFRLKVSPPCTRRDQLSVWPRWTDRDGSGSLILNNLFHLSIKASNAAA